MAIDHYVGFYPLKLSQSILHIPAQKQQRKVENYMETNTPVWPFSEGDDRLAIGR